ncbi:hypothetical protein HMF3257_06735 [Spirosoma telluris]|uniref:Uncharacterized protein n=1 Tax=Spirosoma telluris TaxID=2183553 RepID=A0A327NJC0_9BACT|nr:hypothetical protein HMF3257_06735 [Spirosoma telluris]
MTEYKRERLIVNLVTLEKVDARYPVVNGRRDIFFNTALGIRLACHNEYLTYTYSVDSSIC